MRENNSLRTISVVGGLELKDVFIGRSEINDCRGNPYYFFVFNATKDIFVSQQMLSGARWEEQLNHLLHHLIKISKKDTEDINILDVGANLGAFSLYASSLGCRVYSFEMQPDIYTLLEMSRRIIMIVRQHLMQLSLMLKDK